MNETDISTIYAYVPCLTDKFGVGSPPKPGEDPFASWGKAFIAQVPTLNPEIVRASKSSPVELVQVLISRFDATFVLVDEGEVSVFRRRKKVKLPTEFTSKLKNMLHIYPCDQVGWFQSLDAQPVNLTAAEALYGESADNVGIGSPPPPSDRVSRTARSDLRRKFWSDRHSPENASDIVDILLDIPK